MMDKETSQTGIDNLTNSQSDKIRHPKKGAFLAAFAQCGNVTQAAEFSGVGRATHYEWLKQDTNYAKAFEDAFEQAADRLEAEAMRRAVEGVEEPIYHQGVKVGSKLRYSDTLLIFMLKGARPGKYAEYRRIDACHKVNANQTKSTADMTQTERHAKLKYLLGFYQETHAGTPVELEGEA